MQSGTALVMQNGILQNRFSGAAIQGDSMHGMLLRFCAFCTSALLRLARLRFCALSARFLRVCASALLRFSASALDRFNASVRQRFCASALLRLCASALQRFLRFSAWFWFALFCSISFCSVMFRSVLFCSALCLFYPVMF
jgi:hypothetical protein